MSVSNPNFRGAHPPLAFELEGLRHDRNRQDAEFLRCPGNDRRGARTRAASHAGGDEEKMYTIQIGADFLDRFLGGGSANFRPGTRSEPLGDANAHLDDGARARCRKSLGIGVCGDEVHAFEAAFDHVVDRVAAGAADADDRDARPQLRQSWKLQVYSHGRPRRLRS